MEIIQEKGYNQLVNKDVSQLYSLKPMAMSSSLSESLPSYIMRLAMSHSVTVGTLVQYIIIPSLKSNCYLLNGKPSNLYQKIRLMSSSSLLSREINRVLTELSGNNDLRSLNFINCFSKSGTFKNSRTWCPHCLEQFKLEGGIIYEPLIWNFSIVEFCKKHKYPLQRKCPNCRQEMHLITPTSIPGYCSKCRCWLGNTNSYPKNLLIEKEQWHWWVYDNIAELISELPRISQINDKDLIANNLKKIVNYYSGSMRKFAQLVELPHGSLYALVNKDVRPNLNLLLGVGYCIGLTIKQIATEQLMLDRAEITLLRQPAKKHTPINRTIDWELCEQRLNSAILDSFPPSILEIAIEVSVRSETLSRHFPEKVRDIVAKRREFIRKRSLKKELEEQEEIERTVIKIYHRGKYPTRSSVSHEMGREWLYKNKSNYLAWKKAVLSLGLKIDSRN